MSPLGWIHTALAVLAMAFGAWVILARKGGRRHRQVGYAYAISMLLMNATALMIYRLFGGFGPFHGFAIFSLVTLALGVGAAIRRRPGWFHMHYYMMCWSVVGLYAAFWSEVGARVVPMARFWPAVIGATVLTTIIGAVLIRRHRDRFVARFAPQG